MFKFWKKKIKHATIDRIPVCQFPFPAQGGYYEVYNHEDSNCTECLRVIQVYQESL